jgi:hypothetical protein
MLYEYMLIMFVIFNTAFFYPPSLFSSAYIFNIKYSFDSLFRFRLIAGAERELWTIKQALIDGVG